MSSLYSKYEKSTITKFDIIGSYFVGIYYNDLYLKAEQLRNEGKYDSLTQSYQNVLYNYIQFTQTKDFFRKTILGIHNYFISTTKFVSMTYKECIDFIVSEFIPTHLFDNVKETRKYNILNNILIDCLKIFTEKILNSQIVPIIDNHFEHANINILQNIYLEIILLEKDKMYARFINPDKRNHTIPAELYNNIQKQLKKLTIENKELKNELSQIKNSVDNETNRLKELGMQVIKQNKQLQQELEGYKNKVYNLENSAIKNHSVPQQISHPNIEIKSSPLTTTYSNNKLPKHSTPIYQQSNNNKKPEDIPNLENKIHQNLSPNEDESSNEDTSTVKNILEGIEEHNKENIINEDNNIPSDIGKSLIKQEIDEKQEEFLNEMNDDDEDDFNNFVQFS